MSALIYIDPGTTHSGWVLMRGPVLWNSGVCENGEILDMLRGTPLASVAIEMIASYGMAVGKEVFETCVWIGRMVQVAGPERVRLVYRQEVKMHLCNSPRAKDANIRAAIIDLYGGKAEAIGTVKRQGPLYGVKSHAWAALGVAITAASTN